MTNYTEKNSSYKKYENIEALRFVFAVSIVYFHLLHSAIIPYTGDSCVYEYLAEQSKYTKYIVECFFIISGYFFYQSVHRYPDRKTGDFIWGRISRLWPVLACSTLISMIFLNKSVCSGIINLFFLQSTGLTTDWKGLNWYVSAFFFAEIFYFMFHKAVRNIELRRLLICLIVYFGYVLNITETGGGFGRKTVYGIFSLALARAVAGMGLGYLIGEVYRTAANWWKKQKNICLKKIINPVITVIETGTLILLTIDFYKGTAADKNQFIVVIFFSVLFVCMLTEKGLVSQVLVRCRLNRLGKYGYSIYVMQEAAFLVLKKTFWKNTFFIQEHIWESLFISVVAAVFLGMVVYYIVEKPGGQILYALSGYKNSREKKPHTDCAV